jgi:glycine cleavage system H protein
METVRFRHAHFSARFPVDCLYTPSHFWIRPAGGAAGQAAAEAANNLADCDTPRLWHVGFTKFATRMLGELVEMVLEVKPGQTVAGGERLGTVEGFKAVSDLFCVLDGTLSATNPALTAEACLTHSDPYGAGWLYAVDGRPTPGYLDVHGYIALLTATIDQLQASRYSDGDGHAAAEPAASAESEPGDNA